MATVNIGGIHAKVDFRSAVGTIRYYVRDKALTSINAPGVKEYVYQDIYERVLIPKVPVDSSAFLYSPVEPGSSHKSKRGSTRISQGAITNQGIEWDPYQVSKKHGEIHYADAVMRYRGFRPMRIINDNYDALIDIVEEAITENWQE